MLPTLKPVTPPASTDVAEPNQLARLVAFADVCSGTLEADTVMARAASAFIEWGLCDVVGIVFPANLLSDDPVIHLTSRAPMSELRQQEAHQTLLESLVEHGLAEDVPEAFRAVAGPAFSPIDDSLRADVIHPMVQGVLDPGDGAFATVVLFGYQNWILSPRSRRLLAQAMTFLSRALHHALCMLYLERRSTEDPLTGAFNRRAFDQALPREMERSRRTGRPLSVVLIDVDHFKQVNDTLGHAAGDALLLDLANRTREVMRCSDLFFRLGGDEFALILPEADEAAAEQVALRISRACQTLEEGPVPVTLSMGVAALPPGGSLGYEALVDQADQALYAAKRGGRAQVSRASAG